MYTLFQNKCSQSLFHYIFHTIRYMDVASAKAELQKFTRNYDWQCLAWHAIHWLWLDIFDCLHNHLILGSRSGIFKP